LLLSSILISFEHIYDVPFYKLNLMLPFLMLKLFLMLTSWCSRLLWSMPPQSNNLTIFSQFIHSHLYLLNKRRTVFVLTFKGVTKALRSQSHEIVWKVFQPPTKIKPKYKIFSSSKSSMSNSRFLVIFYVNKTDD